LNIIHNPGRIILFAIASLLIAACSSGGGGGDDDNSSKTGITPLICPDFDGTPFVAFTADPTINLESELFVAKYDGSEVNKVSGNLAVQGEVVSFSVSPDNKYVMYVTRDNVLYAACTDGSAITRVSPGLVSTSAEGFKWSPLSTHIAYRSDPEVDTKYELYVFELTTGTTTKVSGELPAGGDVDGQVSINGRTVFFQWAPDGTALVYTADQEVNNDFEMYVSSVDGSTNVNISEGVHGASHYFRPDFIWSPDSNYIAFRVAFGASIRLYVAARDGLSINDLSGELVTGGGVTSNLGNEFSGQIMQWAPDSSRIAYVADKETNDIFELYTNTPDGLNDMKISSLPMGGNGASLPAWSPDSTRVLYRADQGNSSFGVQYFVATGDGLSNSQVSYSNVESARAGKWSPDGQFIGYIGHEVGDSGRYLHVTDPDGGSGVTVAIFEPGTGIDNNFFWSPDSQYIAYPMFTISGSNTYRTLHVTSANSDTALEVSGFLYASLGTPTVIEWASNSTNLYHLVQEPTHLLSVYSVDITGGNRIDLAESIEPIGGVNRDIQGNH